MAASGTASSSAAPAPDTQRRAANTSGGQKSKGKNPWLGDAAEENPWLATASSEPAAGTDQSSVASALSVTEDKKTKRRGAAESAQPGSKRRRGRSVKDEAEDEKEQESVQNELHMTSADELLNVLDADAESARQQRDLVRATFVEGTQAEDFDEEKEEKLREAEEKDNPTQLSGWGSWTGAGVKPRPAPKKKQTAPKAAALKAGAQHSTPKPPHVQLYDGDADVKAQAKYFVDKVPYPFKNPQQYDQEMRMPSGPEWNTLSGHLQRVKPKIFMKVGAVVPPLQFIKHLPPEQQESAINTWAAGKQPKRLKARF